MFARLDRRGRGGTGVGSRVMGSGDDSIEIILRLGDISDLTVTGMFLVLVSIAYMILRLGDILACRVGVVYVILRLGDRLRQNPFWVGTSDPKPNPLGFGFRPL